MRFIYQYPDLNAPEPDMLDVGPVAEIAQAVEAAGWDGLAFTEHPAPGARWMESGGHQTLDPFIALGHAAAVTTRIHLLTYLAVVPYRNPLLLAKSAATVDRLSNGRFILGVGTGYLRGEFRALGVDFDERNALFDEALEVMALHWSGEPFDYQGMHFQAKGTLARPAPVNRSVPIWIGGNAKITRRRVAEKAQGWMPLGGSAEMLQTTRTPSVGTDDDLGGLIAEVKDMAGSRGPELSFVFAYLDRSLDEPAEAERHRDALGRLSAIGITHVVVPGPQLAPAAGLDWIRSAPELCFGERSAA